MQLSPQVLGDQLIWRGWRRKAKESTGKHDRLGSTENERWTGNRRATNRGHSQTGGGKDFQQNQAIKKDAFEMALNHPAMPSSSASCQSPHLQVAECCFKMHKSEMACRRVYKFLSRTQNHMREQLVEPSTLFTS